VFWHIDVRLTSEAEHIVLTGTESNLKQTCNSPVKVLLIPNTLRILLVHHIIIHYFKESQKLTARMGLLNPHAALLGGDDEGWQAKAAR